MRHLRGALVLAVGLAACNEPRPASPELWTLFDVKSLYAGGAQPTDPIAIDAGLPGGVPLGSMVEPDGTLFVLPGWAEGYAVGYVTTEVWSHFDQVWAQPMYVPITGWDGVEPRRVVDGSGAWHPIFSVGPDSLFYSPFWELIYVLVPETINDGDLTSVRQVLDGGYPLFPSTGWVAALSPGGIGLDTTAAPPTAGGALPGEGWLDGAPISFIKFPAAPFWFDDELVVEEIPIFHFLFVKDDGSLIAPPIPSVLGTGPLYSKRPAPLDVNGLPTAKYSAYWRVYTVTVPLTGRVFALPDSQLAMDLAETGIATDATYGADIRMPADVGVEAFVATLPGRVALAPTCFTLLAAADPQKEACRYLDSQARIEAYLPPDAIVRTDITVTCPLVSLLGAPVRP